MNLRDALAAAERRLAAAGCETPGLDARVLLGHVTGRDHAGLLAHDTDPLGPHASGFESLVRRRVRREPVAYLTGRKEFFSLSFEVTPEVLVPRPETELLVEAGLEFLRDRGGTASVVDVGTGSGAIAISLATEIGGLRIAALDRSAGALAVARRNVRRLVPDGAGSCLDLVRGDLTSSLADRSVDLVVSNPPYLTTEEMRKAAPELAFEPTLALDGGTADGLGVVRRLVAEARRVLRGGGRLLCEIGAEQGPRAVDLASTAGFAEAGVLRDLRGRGRVLKAELAAPD